MMTVKAVIFDLDGTLLDTLDDLTDAVNHALCKLGFAVVDRRRVRRYVGNGVPKLIERILFYCTTGCEPDLDADNETDAAMFSECLRHFTEYYNAHSADRTKPYDGVLQMLAEAKLRGLKTAIVTNKYEQAAVALKDRFFASVDAIVGARTGIRPKPAPDGVFAALDMLGVDKEDAVYVGDGETDIRTAKACGMPVIAVTWGFRDGEVLQKLSPDCMIDAPSEIYSTAFFGGER